MIPLLAAAVLALQAKDSYEDKALGVSISKPKDAKAAGSWTIRPNQYGLTAAVEHKDAHVYAGVLIDLHPYQLYEGRAEKPATLADDLEKKLKEFWKELKRRSRKDAASPTGERAVALEFEAADDAGRKVELRYWVFNNKVTSAPTYLVISTPAGKFKDYEKEAAEILKSVRYFKR